MQKTFNTKKFLSQNSIWLVLIVLVIIMSIAQPSFFSVDNLLTLLSGEAVKVSWPLALCSQSFLKVST